METVVLSAVLEAVGVLAGVLIAFSIDAAWDSHDVDGILTFYTDDAVDEEVPGS